MGSNGTSSPRNPPCSSLCPPSSPLPPLSPLNSDVRTGGYGMMPTLPRRGMGQTLADGNNLK